MQARTATLAGRAGLRLGLACWLPALGAGLLLLNLWGARRFFHDDAFIELRYAANLLHGDGLGWNPGERIEGFTSPLHLALVSLVGAPGVDLELAARLVNFAALAGLLIAFAVALRRAGLRSNTASGFAWLALLAALPLAAWTMGGLEAVLVAFLVCAAQPGLTAALRMETPATKPLLGAGVAFALAVLARPDAAAPLLGAAGALALVAPWPARRRIEAMLLLIGPTVLAGLAITGFRLGYFGDLLPNTYYAKVYGIALGHRLALGGGYLLISALAMPGLALVALVVLARPAWLKRPQIAVLAAQIAATAGYVVWAGGDHMILARFLVPAIPLSALLIGHFLADPAAPAIARALAAAAALLTAAAPLGTAPQTMDPAAWVGQLVGFYVDRAWPADSVVALNTAGATPYAAPRLRYIEMLGINDRTIAHRRIARYASAAQSLPGHAKGDGAYVLARKPDYIIAGIAEGQPAAASPFFGDAEFAALPEFVRCYRLDTAQIPYDAAYARLGPVRPNPLIFTFYRRVC